MTAVHIPVGSEHFILNIGTLLIGCTATALNTLILGAILNTTTRGRRKQSILFAIVLSSSGWILGTGYAISTGVRLAQMVNTTLPEYSLNKLQCGAVSFLVLFGCVFEQLILFFIALDRLFALGWPIVYYSARTNKIQRDAVIVSMIICVTFVLAGFVGVDLNQRVLLCHLTAAYDSVLRRIWRYTNTVLAYLVLTMYAGVYCLSKFTQRRSTLRRRTSNIGETLQRKRQIRITSVISYTVLSYALTMVTGLTMADVLPHVPFFMSNLDARVAVFEIGTLLMAMSTLSNVLVYFWQDKSMQNLCGMYKISCKRLSNNEDRDSSSSDGNNSYNHVGSREAGTTTAMLCTNSTENQTHKPVLKQASNAAKLKSVHRQQQQLQGIAKAELARL